jgi:hypothetical protein
MSLQQKAAKTKHELFQDLVAYDIHGVSYSWADSRCTWCRFLSNEPSYCDQQCTQGSYSQGYISCNNDLPSEDVQGFTAYKSNRVRIKNQLLMYKDSLIYDFQKYYSLKLKLFQIVQSMSSVQRLRVQWQSLEPSRNRKINLHNCNCLRHTKKKQRPVRVG